MLYMLVQKIDPEALDSLLEVKLDCLNIVLFLQGKFIVKILRFLRT